jgi:DNA-binding CsgD family transcriptional regulator
MTVSASLLRGLIAGLEELYSPAAGTRQAACVVSVVRGMLSCESCSYNHFDSGGLLAWQVEPAGVGAFPDARALFHQHMPQHPVLAYHRGTGDGGARRVSDFLSDRQFRALGLYRDFYRPAGVGYQVAITVPAPGGGHIGIAVNRQRRDFSDDEAELVDLLRPHIRQAAAISRLLNQPAPGTPPAPGSLPITPHQVRIMQLVADGNPDRAIARALGISTRTVHAHLQNIYRRLDVTSRTEALARLGSVFPLPR